MRAKGLPWSSGIGIDVKDCTTAREVIEKAKLNWMVDKCELVAKMPFRFNMNREEKYVGEFIHDANMYVPCPNAYATYRTDVNIPLGLVKSKYEIVQNSDAFNFFDEAIGTDKALWQTAGIFGYGHKVFISAKLPIETTVKGDPIDNYLVFSNSHDGSSSLNIMFTPVRVFCTNCLNSAKESALSQIRLRHTKTVGDKLNFGAQVLAEAIEHAEYAQELYNALYVINMTDEQVMRYLANLNLTQSEIIALMEHDKNRGYWKLYRRDWLTLEHTGISTRKVNKIINMWEYYNTGIAQDKIIGTAWGAYNAVTGYYSNVDNKTGEKRMDSLLYGGGFNSTQRAFEEAFRQAS